MKKIFIVLVSLFACVSVVSAAKKEYLLMKDATTINYFFDFSSMKIMKVDVKSYIEMTLNMPFEKFKKNVENIIIQAANEESEKADVKLVKDEKADVELIVSFLDTDPDGEHHIQLVLFHKPSKTTIISEREGMDGGDGETLIEMFMTGLTNTGEKIGKKIKKIKTEAIKNK